ncbi:hypothetical protein [Dongia sp.]|uniref:hypothetical protein n=1 Tax=Dongia sp. TaxID=1977262 RepID=UPI0035B2F4C8
MECEYTGPNVPLRQGDIIAAHPSTGAWANPWTRFGIVLSADCDLANGKTGPNLLYLPAVGHAFFLGTVWRNEQSKELERKAKPAVEKMLNEYGAADKYRALTYWAEQGGTARQIEELERLKKATDIKISAKEIVDLWDADQAIQKLSAIGYGSTAIDERKALDELFALKQKLERTRYDEDRRRSTLEQALDSLRHRTDTWLIRELQGLDPEMHSGSEYGLVVPLRMISALPAGAIVLDRAEWYSDPTKYLRICRLRGIYKTDLLQKFSNLFVRIGLDDHRDEEHQRVFKRLATFLTRGDAI